MQYFAGRCSARSVPVNQLDYQIEPQHFATVEGVKLPVRGPFTQAVSNRGTAVLYVSQPGEVPLYFSFTPGWIHWHEQKLALPGKPDRVPQGCALFWSPEACHVELIEDLPLPSIAPPISQAEAIAQYQQCLLNAVKRRVGKQRVVAVAQSGGPDSLLLTWALLQLGIQPVPLTVCTSPDVLDITAARAATIKMRCPTIPIVVTEADLKPLIYEACLCLEEIESSNIRMAIGNILMARKCQELGINLIFIGHGQDDVFGKGTLMKAVVAEQIGTPSERWRDARQVGTAATAGMMKMFASTFRRYGVETRMPYYDSELLVWAFSQPVEVLPIEFKKQFVHTVARACLPPGSWLNPKHSIGYLTGAGLSLKGRFKQHPLFQEKVFRQQLQQIKALPLTTRIQLHNRS
jgi:asparagine synthetase B (glutamine-hydrolysing)